MARDQSSPAPPPDTKREASWRDRWFAGVTRNGVLLVAAAALANALTRAGPMAYQGEAWLSWSVQKFFTTMLLMAITMLSVMAAINRASSAPRWRYPALGLAILVATPLGAAVASLIENRGWEGFAAAVADNGGVGWWLYQYLLRYGVIVLLFAAVFIFYRLREEHEAATRQAELDRARSEEQMEEARLAMLQAQIEPHFLFNTLANVRRLYQTERAAAESMLQNLMRYLAVALPQMRASHSTLGREATLTESYLEIQRIRMGRRLAFAIDVPPALRGVALPPLMLVTLVENAIKHGINPLPEGGFVRVSARVEDDKLRIEVSDSGQGFTKTSGGGTGLANIRARLAAMYGRAAQLTLGLNRPRGVTATIALPFAAAASEPPQ